jgi:hypothetical protein
MNHKVRVHEWDESKARRRVPLGLLGEFAFDGPTIVDGVGDVDTVRRIALDEIGRRFPSRLIHGLSCLVGGGLTAVLSPAKGTAP